MTELAFISHTADRTTFKVGSHHYAREFSALGWDVLHLSTPYSRMLGALGRDDRRPLAAESPFVDVHGTTHVVPTRNVPARWSHRWLDVHREVDAAGFGQSAWAVVDQPLLHRAVEAFSARTKICYRPTDMYTDGAYAAGQAALLRRADAVVATSPVVLAELGLPAGVPTTIIENGVDLTAFTAVGVDEGGRSGAVYVGVMDGRFDWSMLAHMAEAVKQHSGETVRVYGPTPTSVPFELPTNVVLEGPIAYAAVPDVLASARVGLMPFDASRLNAGRSPMKLYEYLAAGLAVVAPSYLDRVSPALRDHLFLYEDVRDVGAAVESAMSLPHGDVSSLLQEHAWPRKALELQTFLASVA